jgi:hypothetical protein
MHDLIQEMGKQIVREESLKNPGQRSRLFNPKEVCDVLKKNKVRDDTLNCLPKHVFSLHKMQLTTEILTLRFFSTGI